MANWTNEEDKTKIRALREEGLSYRKIGERTGWNRETVRLVCDPKAREQNRKANAKYRAENREKEKARRAKYYAENKEEALAQNAKYYVDHREEILARDIKYCEENPEKIKAYQVEYRKENREKIKARMAKWRAENPEKKRAYNTRYQRTPKGRACSHNQCHKRRELKQRGDGLTPTEFKQIYEQTWKGQEGKCAYCGCKMIRFEDIQGTLMEKTAPTCAPNYCTIDHIVPLSKGGLHEASNIVLACRRCNRKKSDKIWEPQYLKAG